MALAGGVSALAQEHGGLATRRACGDGQTLRERVIHDRSRWTAYQHREVLALTRSNHISGVPVVDGSELVGIVTGRDLRFETRLTRKSV